jgi:hypothetical protein
MASAMPCLEPSYELAVSLLRALYSAKTPEESRLRKAALVHTIYANLLSGTLAEEAATSTPPPPRGRASEVAE